MINLIDALNKTIPIYSSVLQYGHAKFQLVFFFGYQILFFPLLQLYYCIQLFIFIPITSIFPFHIWFKFKKVHFFLQQISRNVNFLILSSNRSKFRLQDILANIIIIPTIYRIFFTFQMQYQVIFMDCFRQNFEQAPKCFIISISLIQNLSLSEFKLLVRQLEIEPDLSDFKHHTFS